MVFLLHCSRNRSNSAGFTEVRGELFMLISEVSKIGLCRQAEHIRNSMTGHGKRSESTSSEWAWHHWRLYCCDALRPHHAAAESAVCAERLCLRWLSSKVHTVGIQGEGREGDRTWTEKIKQSTVFSRYFNYTFRFLSIWVVCFCKLNSRHAFATPKCSERSPLSIIKWSCVNMKINNNVAAFP